MCNKSPRKYRKDVGIDAAQEVVVDHRKSHEGIICSYNSQRMNSDSEQTRQNIGSTTHLSQKNDSENPSMSRGGNRGLSMENPFERAC
jgi:bifunctional DNA-binding transcriptional regulator/antitoxin component of YhaV-PrlF toxin-antitoxin module